MAVQNTEKKSILKEVEEKARDKGTITDKEILDIIGDLYLTGVNPLSLNAHIIVKEAGHTVHVKAANLLKEKLIKE